MHRTAGGRQMSRITSYNVCYTKLLHDASERHPPELQQPVELLGVVDAVVPLVDVRAHGHVLVRHVPQVFGPGLVENPAELDGLVGAGSYNFV